MCGEVIKTLWMLSFQYLPVKFLASLLFIPVRNAASGYLSLWSSQFICHWNSFASQFTTVINPTGCGIFLCSDPNEGIRLQQQSCLFYTLLCIDRITVQIELGWGMGVVPGRNVTDPHCYYTKFTFFPFFKKNTHFLIWCIILVNFHNPEIFSSFIIFFGWDKIYWAFYSPIPESSLYLDFLHASLPYFEPLLVWAVLADWDILCP